MDATPTTKSPNYLPNHLIRCQFSVLYWSSWPISQRKYKPDFILVVDNVWVSVGVSWKNKELRQTGLLQTNSLPKGS